MGGRVSGRVQHASLGVAENNGAGIFVEELWVCFGQRKTGKDEEGDRVRCGVVGDFVILETTGAILSLAWCICRETDR
jgi:hypothetical protein